MHPIYRLSSIYWLSVPILSTLSILVLLVITNYIACARVSIIR